jgi:hypothetical protein
LNHRSRDFSPRHADGSAKTGGVRPYFPRISYSGVGRFSLVARSDLPSAL